jgi:hypothetical protein
MSSIKVVQQGLEKDLLRAKEMINNGENEFVVLQHTLQSLEIVNKQLLLELKWENNNNDKK